MSELGSITIIIRTIGERTEAACRAAILAQGVAEAQVVTVREAPFSKAMRVGFTAGISAGRPWTFCVDADVILRPGSIEAMMRQAEAQPSSVFELQGLVMDKLFVTLREAGNHLFRTSLLDQMIDCIPDEGTSLRPENTAMQRMTERGYRWVKVPYVVGLHDFGQFNKDIFRKCYTHAHKHIHLLSDLLPRMIQRAGEDPDFVVAIEGIAEGVRARSEVKIDVRHLPFIERFKALGIPEKGPERGDGFTPERVEQVLCDWAKASDLTVRFLPVSGPEAVALDGSTLLTSSERWRALFRRKRQELGIAGLAAFTIGQVLEMAGKGFKNMVRENQ